MNVLLREIARRELDAETLAELEKCAQRIGTRFTLFEGQVTGMVRILFHAALYPSEYAVRAFVAEEFSALPREYLGTPQ
jgi:hypothetical protein